MDSIILKVGLTPTPLSFFWQRNLSLNSSWSTLVAHTNRRRRLPKHLRYPPRRTKLPPDLGVNLFLKTTKPVNAPTMNTQEEQEEDEEEEGEEKQHQPEDDDHDDVVWDSDEIEAITSLFQGRIPQKPGKLNRERPLPLPLPYKLRPLGLPTSKKRPKIPSLPSMQMYKNPAALIGLARKIKSLPAEEDVSVVLNKWVIFLQRGSLSMTIRELGLMGLPDRALQTFCWVQRQPHLFPDDRTLATTIEVLARNHELKMPFDLEKFVALASRNVIEAMVRGLTAGGSLNLAWKVVLIAKDGKRMLDPSVYAKLILELAKNPDKYVLAEVLLNELGEREDLNLSQQDCTAIMKVCTRLGKSETVEGLYNWFKQSGRDPSVVMYTTLIHSRYLEKKYREALAVVWEMEATNCLFDLPAYRTVIKLFVALNDLSRAVRYFSRLKEAGFSPTYDVYRDLIRIYMVSGRLAKCKDVYKEAELAGFKLDKETMSQLQQLEEKKCYIYSCG